MKTQREKFAIAHLSAEIYEQYLLFCAENNEIPRKEIVLLIKSSENIEQMLKVLKTFKEKRGI